MTPQEFITKWKRANLSDRLACQQHFLDLCDVFNHPKPDTATSTLECNFTQPITLLLEPSI